MLTAETRDDIPVQLSLGLCCFRLMGDQPSDPYYLKAVALYERVGPLLAALIEQHPENALLRKALLENYCSLAVCHGKAGQTARAEQVIQDRVRPSATLASGYSFDPVYGVGLLRTLIYLGGSLRDAKQPGAALPLAREAALLSDRYATAPWPDRVFKEWLEGEALALAVLLRHLGDPAESLRQAEQARRLSRELCHAAPDNLMHEIRLSDAWQQIGKARWDLGQAEESLAAFRESAVVQRQVFEHAPDIHLNRICLSRCYDRLFDWSRQCGKRAEAAAALLEREKLWPDDTAELGKVCARLRGAGESGGRGRRTAFPGRAAQRQDYLAQSERTKRAAAIVAARAGGLPQGTIEGPFREPVVPR